jgi:hypothetical protein
MGPILFRFPKLPPGPQMGPITPIASDGTHYANCLRWDPLRRLVQCSIDACLAESCPLDNGGNRLASLALLTSTLGECFFGWTVKRLLLRLFVLSAFRTRSTERGRKHLAGLVSLRPSSVFSVRIRATPPPGTIPSSTAARVAFRASSTRSLFSLTSTSVEPPKKHTG